MTWAPSRCDPPVDRRTRLAGWVPAVVLGLLVTGCGASGVVERPSSSPAPSDSSTSTSSPSSPATSSPAVSIPEDGIALAAYGFANGPVAQFSLPRGAYLSSGVDQANNVVAVISEPPPEAVANYLRRALPATGFSIDRDDQATRTMTFHGYGWSGSFTSSASTSAVLLRPN